MEDHYLADEIYHRLVAKLAELKPSIWTSDILDPDEIKATLGEVAGIWPEAIRAINLDTSNGNV